MEEALTDLWDSNEVLHAPHFTGGRRLTLFLCPTVPQVRCPSHEILAIEERN